MTMSQNPYRGFRSPPEVKRFFLKLLKGFGECGFCSRWVDL
jgi:hypothetical protein